jgi:hypothetical protein
VTATKSDGASWWRNRWRVYNFALLTAAFSFSCIPEWGQREIFAKLDLDALRDAALQFHRKTFR